MSYGYEQLRVEIEDGVAIATIANPPISLVMLALFGELGGN